MYKFLITPNDFELVTAIIDARWEEPARLQLLGDPLSIQLVCLHIDYFGVSPDGNTVSSKSLAPMDLHRTFISSDDFIFEVVAGELSHRQASRVES